MARECCSDWPQVPDTVLLQAIVLLGPGDVCHIATCCSAWAETVTSSETWLWSVVGLAGLPAEIMERLTRWAKHVRLGLRSALQLWFCRAHLWGGGPAEDDEFASPCSTISFSGFPCDSAVLCTAAWPGAGGDAGAGVAVGFASGVLAFGSLAVSEARAHGLRGSRIDGLAEGLASVRSAHGTQLVTALRPLGRRAQDGVISVGLDGLIRVWDPGSAFEVHQTMTEHARGINDVAVCPVGDEEGRQVLTCGDEGAVLLYQLGTAGAGPRALRSMQGHSAPAYCAAWLAPTLAVTGGFDRKALVWDQRSKTRSPCQMLSLRQHAYSVARLGSGAETSTLLAVGLADGVLCLWDLRRVTKDPLKELRGHGGAVECLATLPGEILASASSDGSLRLWDISRRRENAAWHWQAPVAGPLTSVASVFEDSLLVAGVGMRPTVLSLNYALAAPLLPEVMDRLQLPTLQPWRRGRLPPEGLGRHSALVSLRRSQRTRTMQGSPGTSASSGSHAGKFDRSNKGKPPPQGATGTAHRTLLLSWRR